MYKNILVKDLSKKKINIKKRKKNFSKIIYKKRRNNLKVLRNLLPFSQHNPKNVACLTSKRKKKNYIDYIYSNKWLDNYTLYALNNYRQVRADKYSKQTYKKLLNRIKYIQRLNQDYVLFLGEGGRPIRPYPLEQKKVIGKKSKKKKLNQKKKKYLKKFKRINKKILFLKYKKKNPFFFHNKLYSLYFY
jgi:hypothetical protein